MSDSELAALSQILAAPDDDEAPPPADAQLAPDDDADDDSAEGPLSPEEVVAESYRQDLEASGEEEDEGDDEEEDEDEPDEIEQLRQRAELVEQWEAWYAQTQVQNAARGLETQVQQAVQAAEQHYDAERRRIAAAVWRDAHNAPDPEQYYAANIDAAMRNWAQARETWIGGIYADARARAQVLSAQANKGALADQLIAQHGLPNAPQVKAKLMQVSDPARMPERAAELRDMHLHFQRFYAGVDQQVREERARAVKTAQVPSIAAAAPRRAKPVTYEGTKAELAEILKFERTG